MNKFMLIEYALAFVGTNYKWGGNNALEGFDCSGFVQELLASIGLDPIGRDTAQSLYNYFNINGISIDKPVVGALVFYGKAVNQITHVAMAINDFQIIEAGGGGSKTLTETDAAKQNAVVRIRLYNHRKDIVKVLLPHYPSWTQIP